MNHNQQNVFYVFFLTLIFSFFSFTSIGQDNRFSLIVEYTPNFSKLTNEIIDENYKLSHLALIKIEFETGLKINPSIGFGFMNTGERILTNLDGQFGINKIQFSHHYNYLMVPVGIKLNLKNILFIHPEFGIGFNVSNKIKQTTEFSNGEKEIEKGDFGVLFGEFNKIALPVFLTIGTNIPLGEMDLLIGVKGYYNTKQVIIDVPRKNHSYGFGISLGLKV